MTYIKTTAKLFLRDIKRFGTMALDILFQTGRPKSNKYQNLKLHFKNDVMPILIPMRENKIFYCKNN